MSRESLRCNKQSNWLSFELCDTNNLTVNIVNSNINSRRSETIHY